MSNFNVVCGSKHDLSCGEQKYCVCSPKVEGKNFTVRTVRDFLLKNRKPFYYTHYGNLHMVIYPADIKLPENKLYTGERVA